MNRTYTNSVSNPFSTLGNKLFPKTILNAFDWALWIHDRIPTIGNAINKVVRYFAADITVSTDASPSLTDAGRLKKVLQMLKDQYGLLLKAINVGLLLAIMGNVFVSALRVMNRTLACPKCSFVGSIKKMRKKLDYLYDGLKFTGNCPHCGKVTFKVVDTPSVDEQGRKVRFIVRSPRDMLLRFNELTGEYKYLYKLPSHIKLGILQGDSVYLLSTPMLYLLAAKSTDYIEFPPDMFFHARVNSLASMDRFYKGWGTPLFLSSFNNVLNLAYLDRFNQAVATDYITPIRMISPPQQTLAAGTDPMRQPMSGYMYRQFIEKAVSGAKQNPTQWLISPVPLNYQMLGGEAKQMAPVELMKWYEDRILLDMSIPLLLRQTTFQAVADSMGLRMFEKQWIHYSQHLTDFVKWAAEVICEAHSVEHVDVELDKTSFVLNAMNKQMQMQLAQGGVISMDAFLATLGMDYKTEIHKKMLEQQYEAELAMKMQVKQQEGLMTMSVLPPAGSIGIGAAQANIDAMQQAAQGGAMPPGGAPMPPEAAGMPAGGAMPQMPFNQGNGQSATMDQLYGEAQAKADEIFQIGQTQGPGARISALRQLGAQNPMLHAQVKAILDSRDRQTASQAVAQSKMPQ